ncbi:MAG: hypothetical protein NUW01_06660 [Gemmatimonadaceae bacterium]|nr:hypothetical protein [Gemmatimonadaceae bacterium]
MDPVAEREALETLIASDGWHVYTRRVLAEWKGEGYFARMTMALGADDPVAAKVVHRTAQEIQKSMQWVTDRIAFLRQEES